MSQLRFCLSGGLLVGGNDRLPSDPCEYNERAGCNRLRCPRCNLWVRIGSPGVKLIGDGRPDVGVLFAAERWLDLPFIEQGHPQWRLYACKCQYWEATDPRYLENDHDSPSDPDLPWACAGHPAPDLPLTLGELRIAVDGDWGQVVGKILRGVRPRALDDKHEGPVTWLSWLYRYLAGLPAADRLASALAGRVDDRDPQVVGRVLSFFSRFPEAKGIERLVARAEAAVDKVAVGYPIGELVLSPTLWDVLVARLQRADASPLDPHVRDLVRKVMLIPLSALSHEDVGPSRVELERQRLVRIGWDMNSELAKSHLADYPKRAKAERFDVVQNALADYAHATAFADEDFLLWMAKHIVEIEQAGPGRWRPIMNLLVYWYRRNAELGHLIVIAGIGLIESRHVDVAEFREWMTQNSYSTDEWVPPLEAALKNVK